MKVISTQVHLFYKFTGVRNGNYCFSCVDDYALTLELPWCDYALEFMADPLRPLVVGDMVSVVYERTNRTSPRLQWRPAEWYKMP